MTRELAPDELADRIRARLVARRYLHAQCRLRRRFGRSTAHVIAVRRGWASFGCPVCHAWHVRPHFTLAELERLSLAMRGLDPYREPSPHATNTTV